MMARLVVSLIVALALPAFVLACGGGEDSVTPGSPDTPGTAPTAGPTMGPAAQTQATPPGQAASPSRPESGSAPFNFVVEPPGGPCDQGLQLSASGFMPNETLEVVRLGDTGGATILSVEQTSATGDLSLTVVGALGQCVPGAEVLFALRKDGEWLSGAIYTIDPPGPLLVEPASMRCGDVVTLTGAGFPPGASVSLQIGPDRPMAGDFLPAQKSAVADAGGSIAVELTMGIDAPCPLYEPAARTQHLVFFANVQGSEERWKAPFTLLR